MKMKYIATEIQTHFCLNRPLSSLKFLSSSFVLFLISLQLFILATGPMNISQTHTHHEKDVKYVRTFKQNCQAGYLSSAKVICFLFALFFIFLYE